MAVAEALRRGAKEIVLVGAFGGQTDHMLGHAGLALKLALAGHRTFLTSGRKRNISVTVTNRFIGEVRAKPNTVHMVQNPRTKHWTKLEKRDAEGKPTGQYWTVGEVWNLIIEHWLRPVFKITTLLSDSCDLRQPAAANAA